jgi:hypothetical protein
MTWKPIMYEGSLHVDPRSELKARAKRAELGNDTYVAIPVDLAYACAELRECGARLVVIENGPTSESTLVVCRLPLDHKYEHYNGYIHWTAGEE